MMKQRYIFFKGILIIFGQYFPSKEHYSYSYLQVLKFTSQTIAIPIHTEVGSYSLNTVSQSV